VSSFVSRVRRSHRKRHFVIIGVCWGRESLFRNFSFGANSNPFWSLVRVKVERLLKDAFRLQNCDLALPCGPSGRDVRCFLAILENGASITLVNFLGDLVGWFLVLFLIVTGIPAFTSTYGRRLDLLTGPWITSETSRHD
jgi:hypothetical protein